MRKKVHKKEGWGIRRLLKKSKSKRVGALRDGAKKVQN